MHVPCACSAANAAANKFAAPTFDRSYEVNNSLISTPSNNDDIDASSEDQS